MAAICDQGLAKTMPSDNFPIDEAQLVALFMECIVYGIYVITLVQCLHVLLWSDADNGFKSNVNWPMLIVAILLAVFATLDVVFGLQRNLAAFVFYTGNGGANEEFGFVSNWTSVMKVADCIVQTFVGDGLLIYRCYIVYGKDWRIIIPSTVLWLGGTVSGVLLIITTATLKTNTLLHTPKVAPFVDCVVSLTLSMNILTTSLIIYRIWSVDKQAASIINTCIRTQRVSQLRRAIRIIIDSAALYTISAIIFACTYIAGSNACYATSDVLVQIIGISFNVIIIRANSGRKLVSQEPEVFRPRTPRPPKSPLTSLPHPVLQPRSLELIAIPSSLITSGRSIEATDGAQENVNLTRLRELKVDLPDNYTYDRSKVIRPWDIV